MAFISFNPSLIYLKHTHTHTGGGGGPCVSLPFFFSYFSHCQEQYTLIYKYSNCQLLINVFKKYLWSIFYVLGSVLSTDDLAVNRMVKMHDPYRIFHSSVCNKGIEIINMHANSVLTWYIINRKTKFSS